MINVQHVIGLKTVLYLEISVCVRQATSITLPLLAIILALCAVRHLPFVISVIIVLYALNANKTTFFMIQEVKHNVKLVTNIVRHAMEGQIIAQVVMIKHFSESLSHQLAFADLVM